MRRKNLMRLTAAMGMMMACSQVMQAAAPVWGNETVEETTAGSHDDLIEIPPLEDEEYPVDQGKQNYVDTIVQADNRIGSMLMEKLTAENKNVFISDINTYAHYGIRNIIAYAVYVDAIYYETYKNVNFVQEYGDGLKNYRLPE